MKAPRIRTQIRHQTGETLREIGVLVFVFAPLDAIFARDRLTFTAMAATVVGALLLVVAGMILGLEK
jgi:hypothetical protein